LDTLVDTHRASQAAEQLLSTLAQIRPAHGGANSTALLREEQMLGRIARQFHLSEERLRSRLISLRRGARRRGNGRSSAAVAQVWRSTCVGPRTAGARAARRQLHCAYRRGVRHQPARITYRPANSRRLPHSLERRKQARFWPPACRV
jgi:hypothetical protein